MTSNHILDNLSDKLEAASAAVTAGTGTREDMGTAFEQFDRALVAHQRVCTATPTADTARQIAEQDAYPGFNIADEIQTGIEIVMSRWFNEDQVDTLNIAQEVAIAAIDRFTSMDVTEYVYAAQEA